MTAKKLIIFILGMFLFWSCEEANPIRDEGKDVLQVYGTMKSDTLYAVADTFLIAGKTNTGSSPKLLLGSYNEFEGRFLVKFSSFPDDSIEVESLAIIISAPGVFGDDINPLTGTVYRVTGTWAEDVNSDASWDYRSNIDMSPETKAEFTLSALDTTVYTDYHIDLPVQLIDIWRDTTAGDQNNGLLLDFNGADHIKEFSSREGLFASRRPRLVYTYRDQTNDTTLHDTVTSTLDASLIDYTGTFDRDKIYVCAGYETDAFFEFKLDSIPNNAYMVSVQFRFTEDSLVSLKNPNRTTEIYLRNAITGYNELPAYQLDSTFTISTNYSVVLTESSAHILSLRDTRRAVISRAFIQDIINGFIPNGSFFLQYVSPGNDISLYAIRSTEQATAKDRPHIILEYYLQTAPRL